MSVEFAIIAGSSVAGALSAALIEKFSRERAAGEKKSPQIKSASAARVELTSLLFEKSLISESITRVYEASQDGRIDRLERDRLLLKYKQQLDSLNQRTAHLQPVADYADLSELRNSLMSLLQERISSLDQRLLQMSKSGIAVPDVESKAQKIIAETSKVQTSTAAIEHRNFKVEERSIEQLQNEIVQALQRLEQVEIDKD